LECFKIVEETTKNKIFKCKALKHLFNDHHQVEKIKQLRKRLGNGKTSIKKRHHNKKIRKAMLTKTRRVTIKQKPKKINSLEYWNPKI